MSAAGPASFISYDSILLRHPRPVDRAFLLFHGLTASPLQFLEFGRALHARGANVWIPRLPHHGYSDRLTTELERLTASELRAFAGEHAAFVQTLAPRATVAGFSLGGLLAAYIAQHLRFHRGVCIAPYLGPPWLPNRMSASAASLALGMPNRFVWWNPRLRERQMPAHGYPRFPTHAVAHATVLAAEVLRDAERRAPATASVCIVVNASEAAVNNRTARRLAGYWSARTNCGIVMQRLVGLPFSHDIIEPEAPGGLAARVYPALLDLVDR